jgi:hypothetical protein
VNKKNDLKIVQEKVEKLDLNKNKLKDGDYNMIYRFKLESKICIKFYIETKGDSLFSSVNDTSYRNVGSTLGIRTAAYLDHVNRYHQSKNLILNATEYERNWIRNFTNFVLKKTWRHKVNYGLKIGLATMFLYNLCLAKENLSIYMLRRPVSPKVGEMVRIYYNSGITFAMAFLAFVYI